MVLYCTQHPSNIIRAIVHKMKYHENEDAIIIGEPDLHTPYYPQIPGIFYLQTPSIWKMVSFSDEREKLIQNIQTTIDNFAESNQLNFKEFTHRYALYDMYNPFTVYFEQNSVDYECIEAVNNLFYLYYAQGPQMVAARPDSCKCYNTLILELHSQDGAGKHCLKGYLYSGKSRKPEDKNAQYEVFDYLNSIPDLKPEQKEMLLSAYQIKECAYDSIFLLNSPGLTMDQLERNHALPLEKSKSNDGQMIASLFYLEIIDYYLPDRKVALKLHPAADSKMISSFSSFEQISNYIPFELFILLDKKYQLFNVCSSADEIFKERGWDVVTFGDRMFSFFKYIHFVSLAFRFIERLSIPDQIYVYGLDIQQLNFFRDYAHPSFGSVQFVQLTAQNAPETEFIVAVPDPAFYTVTKSASKNAVIVTNQQASIEGYRQILMKCSVADISESKNNAIQEFEWSVHANAGNICQIASCFFAAYILKNAKIKIQSKPSVPVLVNTDNTHNDIESLKAVLEGKIDRMMEFLLNPSEVTMKLSRIQDFSEYLGWLDVLKYKYVILFSVKDTPGSALPNHLVQSIRDLGFSEFTKDLWMMYAGMIGKGHVIANRRGANREDPVEIQYVDMNSGTKYIVRSQAWKKGNKAEILINGQDYAANIRGINIVVYDPESQTVIDSIGFDHHDSQSQFVRKER